ncbi:methionine aminotransferase [Danxiaibacter flavus]|uniref:Methionine aminotransferase n=1 Tax=Danxiaibacter flavus TaxID=3049108 RepID=A0ABV3ZJM8_9BACT|nr:methionine aminotransferase [Chitinophagaceae bacterium DXS]
MNVQELLTSKLPNVGTTVFTTMSQLALEHNAINLGQGFPDFPMSEELTALVCKAMRDGFNQYSHMNGVPSLRDGIAEKVSALYKTNIHPNEQITVTPGGTYAIYTALTTILQPGDEVIVFEPAYDSYIPNIEVNGAVPVRISLQYPDYAIPWQTVKERLTAKTKAIIINSPHNPTGVVLSANDIQQLKNLVEGTGIFIISDEVYEHLVFDGLQHESILRYPELLARSFVCFSFGKTYHCTGWKIGYCIAPSALMKEFRKVHQFNCFSTDTPKQIALATYIHNKDAYLSLAAFIQKKRDYFKELMSGTLFRPLTSHGSYFQCYDYSAVSNEKDIDFATRITKEYGVTAIPVSVFYKDGEDNKVVRFCFAKQEETLRLAAERLRNIKPVL